MKKLSIIVVVLAILCMFCFAGCIMQPGVAQDLSVQDTGYDFEIYPTVEFNYKIKDDFIVHISNISATLVKKNEINANDTIEGDFYPYVTMIEVTGETDPKYAGTTISISFSNGSNTPSCIATIDENGAFYGSSESMTLRNTNTIYLFRIAIYR